MFSVRPTAVMLGILALAPAIALATPRPQTPSPARTAPAAAIHATSGVVKTVSATSLVITRSSGAAKEMTFVVNVSTQKKGTLAAGVKVDVRYRVEGKINIATAISVQTRKPPFGRSRRGGRARLFTVPAGA